jgi:hypothetical protein
MHFTISLKIIMLNWIKIIRFLNTTSGRLSFMSYPMLYFWLHNVFLPGKTCKKCLIFS